MCHCPSICLITIWHRAKGLIARTLMEVARVQALDPRDVEDIDIYELDGSRQADQSIRVVIQLHLKGR